MDNDECGAVGGISGKGNKSARGKSDPVQPALSTTSPT
jgi:hypothetical protein